MAANTPIAREVAQGNSQASNTPDELIDLKAFELLDDVYNAVNDYTAHGINAFEECLAKNLDLDKLQAKILLQEIEQSADAQLAQLRHKIEEVRKERMNLDAQTLGMERELATYGDLSELEAIAATVSGKENVAGDAAVIGSKARELELLVPKIMARQAARADTVLDPQKAAQLADRDMQHRKAAMGEGDASGLRDQLQQP